MTACYMKISDCLCKRLVLRPAKSSMKVLSVDYTTIIENWRQLSDGQIEFAVRRLPTAD